MKLKNSTDWPDYFLRRMVAWCCREVGLPASVVHRIAFGNRSRGAYSGHAWQSMRVHVSIGPESCYPTTGHLYPGCTSEAYRAPALQDRVEGLVAVTAHELTHLRDYHDHRERQRARNELLRAGNFPQPLVKRRRSGERHTMHEERRVIELFRAQRDSLLAAWSEAPTERAVKPVATIQEKRATKAQSDLERWQRKLKLAQTKCRKLKQRVAYYEKSLAAKRGTP